MITIKATVYENKDSRTIEIAKQDNFDKPAIIQDKNFKEGEEARNAFLDKAQTHFAKKLNTAVVFETTVETGESFSGMELKDLKTAAKSAKYTKAALIKEAISARKSEAKASRPRKERLSDEEFEALAEKAKMDIGRSVSLIKYGKEHKQMTGIVRAIRKDKRTNSVQYTIAITDEKGVETGVRYGKVVGSPELEFTSDPVAPAEKPAKKAKKAAKEETPAE